MDRNGRLKALLNEASPREPSPASAGVSVSGPGAVGVVGSYNSVTIVNGATPTVTVLARPGVDHITDEQAACIQELVGIIAGRGRRSFGSVYGDLFRHLGGGHRLVPGYRLIPLEMFPKAERFLTELAEQLRG